VTALLAALALAASDPADSAAAFRQGHERYLAGDFAGAAERYQALADSGHGGAALHYDLGNAWLRAGRPGKAAASWERALAEDPADAEARANLEAVRRAYSQRLPWARGEPLLDRAVARVAGEAATIALAAAWAALFAALAVRLRARGSRRAALSVAAAVAAAAALVSGLAVAGKARELREPRAVVVSAGAPLLEAPSGALRPAMELPEGAPVRVLSAEGEWLRVRLPGGLEGYVRAEEVEVVRAYEAGR
jgi:tetratricopeptide (TPR) repeat protein